MCDAHCCIPEQRRTQAAALLLAIDRERRKQSHRNWIGYVAAEPARRGGNLDRARGQRLIADDFAFFARDECARSSACLIGLRAALEPSIQCRDAAIERLVSSKRSEERRVGK